MDSTKRGLLIVIAVLVVVIGAMAMKMRGGAGVTGTAGVSNSGTESVSGSTGQAVPADYPKTPEGVVRAMVEAYGDVNKADSEKARKYLTPNGIDGRIVLGDIRYGVLDAWHSMLATNSMYHFEIDYNQVIHEEGDLVAKVAVMTVFNDDNTRKPYANFVLVFRDGRWQVDTVAFDPRA